MGTPNQQSFTAQPNIVSPATVQTFPSWNTNAIGSEYAALFNKPETIHIRRAVSKTIIENFPAMYNIFRIVFSKPMKYEPLDEYSWTETPWLRPALYAAAGVGGGTSQSIVLQPGYINSVTFNDIITYPDNTKGLITNVTTSTNTIVVVPKTYGTLPAVLTNDRFTTTPIIADGMNTFFTSSVHAASLPKGN